VMRDKQLTKYKCIV